MQLVLEQTIVNGLLLGAVYSATSLGFSVIFGVLDIVNVAHGEMLMLGAYLAWFLFQVGYIDPIVSALIAFPFFL